MASTTTELSDLTLRQKLRLFRKKIVFWKSRWRPNPRRVILTAYEIGEREGYEKAVTWARRHIPDGSSHGVHILSANRDKANPAMWIRHVNAYLEQFDLSALELAETSAGLVHALRSTPRRTINEGPLVSVIMCAYNAQETIDMAARSILRQSWRPLELLIVDDCSTDDTVSIAMKLAEQDSRVKVHVNAANVGPYVGRNLALRQATGQYVTCHDSDDWAHPERLERQLEFLRRERLVGALAGMLRMRTDGHFVRLQRARRRESDGIVQEAAVSALFEREAFDANLQHWDSVRFSADTELLLRARQIFKNRIRSDFTVSMLTLEHRNSLTADVRTGISEKVGMSAVRKSYGAAHEKWRRESPADGLKMEFPLHTRPFEAPQAVLVPLDNVLTAVSHSRWMPDQVRHVPASSSGFARKQKNT